MSRIAILERRLLARQEAEGKAKSQDDTLLAGALRAGIVRAVKQAVEEALGSAQTPRHETIPHPTRIDALEARLASLEARPVPAPAPVMQEFQIERDGAGLMRAVTVGSRRFTIQRDAAGLPVRIVPADMVPEVDYVGPAAINRRK